MQLLRLSVELHAYFDNLKRCGDERFGKALETKRQLHSGHPYLKSALRGAPEKKPAAPSLA